ncbi:SDR family oxidoreductase [Leptospira yasudae]|uniref:NAD-dependent epimerase/dehydratase family protein n=1 Tax=Leptospira yasudae TaxID=2202201 RepID=UPI001082C593|nr:SDR family oxidoreductase [Leptospira yasudae]TGK24530.1 SDR family oxidoreductase [Leptospira yasudae]TGM05684.1 SDR family oxidoreductase [Leptospira yasudae]
MNRKKILITGGSGLLGGRIAKYFGESEDVIVRLASTKSLVLPDSIRNGEVTSIDWTSESSLNENCKGIDAIVHCAGMNAQDATKNPQSAFEFNGIITGRLLDAGILNNVTRFVYFSTAHVYGSPLQGRIVEDSPLTNTHPYALSNAAGEKEVNDRSSSGKIFGINIRLSNAFGAPVDQNVNCWMLLVNDLCRQAVETGKMILKTSGLQSRDFIPIEDVCRATDHFLNISIETNYRTYNVGGNASLTVWKMANLVRDRCKAVLGFLPDLERVAPMENESVTDLEFDISRLLASGFRLSDSFIREIDQLFVFCNLHFKNSLRLK